MEWIGLTGGIASGKSEVSRILLEQSIPVIDADVLAHQALRPGEEPYAKVVDEFPKSVLSEDGQIDRKALGKIVFFDKEKLQRLEEFIHPYIQERVRQEKQRLANEGKTWAVYDVPLLFEKNLEKNFDRILVVHCRPELQLERLCLRNQLSQQEALARINSQMNLQEKVVRADDAIENNGTLQELEEAVLAWKSATDARCN